MQECRKCNLPAYSQDELKTTIVLRAVIISSEGMAYCDTVVHLDLFSLPEFHTAKFIEEEFVTPVIVAARKFIEEYK